MGRVFAPGSIPELERSLKIQVGSQLVKLPKDVYHEPEFADEEIHVEITNNKAGGLSRGEHFSRV
jgi:hypothetical protein